MLQSWLTEHLKIIQNQADEEEKPELAQCVYAIAMEEIIRQVHVECKERGNLLANIWKAAIVNKSGEETKQSRLTFYF
jgi:hypothetical protein